MKSSCSDRSGGDRWNLLIVRELLVSGRARFTDLQRGLPGIAPNLLTQRLDELLAQDVVRREPLVANARASVYVLTERGRALEGVVRELLKWGAPTVAQAPAEAAFQMHWLSVPARFLLRDHRPASAEAVVRFGDAADGFDVAVAQGSVEVTPVDVGVTPDATVTGRGPALVALLQGAMPLDQALRAGVHADGDVSVLARVLPEA